MGLGYSCSDDGMFCRMLGFLLSGLSAMFYISLTFLLYTVSAFLFVLYVVNVGTVSTQTFK